MWNDAKIFMYSRYPRIYTYILRCTHDKCIIYFMFSSPQSEIWFKHDSDFDAQAEATINSKKIERWCTKMITKIHLFPICKGLRLRLLHYKFGLEISGQGLYYPSGTWAISYGAAKWNAILGGALREFLGLPKCLLLLGITEQDSAELVLGGWGFIFFGVMRKSMHAWEMEAVESIYFPGASCQKIASYFEQKKPGDAVS